MARFLSHRGMIIKARSSKGEQWIRGINKTHNNKQLQNYKQMKAGQNNFLMSIDVKNPISNAIIVGNAYGIMPYIQPLANKLANNSIKPFWFPFSGQENRKGFFSFSQGVKDLNEVIEIVMRESDLPVNLLTHCAGSLIALELLKEKKIIDINKIIIYGLLFSMNRRRAVAERKLINVGVNYNLSEDDWLYDPTDAITSIDKELLFCHPKDKLNLDRATENEMSGLKASGKNIKLKWFSEGYDENIENITKFIDTYVFYLKN